MFKSDSRSRSMAQDGRREPPHGQGSCLGGRTQQSCHNIDTLQLEIALERPRRTQNHSAGTGAVRGTE